MSSGNSPGLSARFILALAGLATIFSLFLPWDHPRTHWNLFLDNYGTFHEIISAEEGEVYWDEALYFLGQGAPALAPAFLGLALLLAALLGPGKPGSLLSGLSYLALFLVAAGSLLVLAWITREDRETSNLPLYYLLGGVLFVVLGTVEVVLIARSLRKFQGRSAMVHAVPLSLFAVGGLIASFALWTNDQWHAVDYLVVGISTTVALIAIRALHPGKKS